VRRAARGTRSCAPGAVALALTLALAAGCSGGGAGGFADAGPLGAAGDSAGAASEVLALAREAAGDTERVVISFATGDGRRAPSVSAVRGELRRDLGVVRIALPPEVVATRATEDRIGGRLAGPVFVVHSLDGPWFVDVHLAAPARARLVARGGGAVAVELVRGGGPLPPPAALGPNAVLLAPRAGPAGGPLEVAGYARTFEANVNVRLLAGGALVADTFTTAADYLSTWGEFRAALPAPPAGRCSVFAGEPEMEGDGWRGAGVAIEGR